METASKLLVLISAVAAVVLQAFIVSRGWGELPVVLVVGAALAFLAAWRWPGFAHGGLAAFGYVAAAVWIVAIGRFYPAYLVVWMGALLAGMLARPGWALRWSVPAPWKIPLATWAVLLAVSWPIVVLRELDFLPRLLLNFRVANTGVGVAPAEAVSGILEFSLTQIVGLLWFDWLSRTYASGDRPRFERQIVLPMGGLALVACLVAVYQGAIDIQWLGRSGFPQLGRAGGTMVDPNAFGVVAALWAPVFLAVGFIVGARRHTRVTMWLGGVALLVASGGVWMSASRTALLALTIGIAGTIGVSARAGSGRLASRRARVLALGAVPAAVLLVVVLLVAASSTGRGPAERIRALVPSASVDSLSTLADRLWNRGWYGPAAHLMIREHPFVGVGVGGYYTLVEQYSRRAGRVVTIDNAQNWYRHQLAELGIMGSLPWIAWLILFAGFLLRSRGEGDRRIPAGAVKASLVGLGVISCLGMPTQNAAVALTFWTFVFWYVRLVPAAVATSGAEKQPATPVGAWRRRLPPTLVVALIAAHAAGTLYAARGDLRVPYRAARGAGSVSGVWTYEYGLYDLEESQSRGPFRWTEDRAVAVIARQRRRLRGYQWMKLTVWASHPDAGERPLSAKVWGYGREIVIDEEQWDGAPLVAYLPVVYGHSLVETWVSRTWRPLDHGANDARELGLAISWEFVETRPAEVASE